VIILSQTNNREVEIMQKISPLRASLDAFNKFKANRAKNINQDIAHTNPFGITFKGTVLQMDVFDSPKKENVQNNVVKEKMAQAGKLLSSAWTSTLDRANGVRQSLVSFGSKIKTNAKDVMDKLTKTEINFDFMKYNVSSLSKRPVSELVIC
jgi:hypothetical protein